MFFFSENSKILTDIWIFLVQNVLEFLHSMHVLIPVLLFLSLNTDILFFGISVILSSDPNVSSIIPNIQTQNPNCLVMVDNCYGEFVENIEPPMVVGNIFHMQNAAL